MEKNSTKKLQTMFCSEFVDHIPKIRQTKPEKLKKRPKIALQYLFKISTFSSTCILNFMYLDVWQSFLHVSKLD